MSYPVFSLGRSYPSAEVQSVYSTAPTPVNWASYSQDGVHSSSYIQFLLSLYLFFGESSESIYFNCITITLLFHSLFVFQLPSKVFVLIYLFTFFQFYFVVCQFTILHVFCCFFLFFCWLSLGLVFRLRLRDPFVSQNPREVSGSHSPGWLRSCASTICLYGHISISCTVPSGSPSPLSRV